MKKMFLGLLLCFVAAGLFAEENELVNSWFVHYDYDFDFDDSSEEIDFDYSGEDLFIDLYEDGTGEIWEGEGSYEIEWETEETEAGVLLSFQVDDEFAYLDLVEIQLQEDVYLVVGYDDEESTLYSGYMFPAMWFK